MFILTIISAGIIFTAVVLAILRLVVERRLFVIQQESNHSLSFRRRLNYIKKLEQARNIRYLFLLSLLSSISVMILTGGFFYLFTENQHLQHESSKGQERIVELEKKQQQLATSIPLKTYPEEGIGLKEYEWDKMKAEDTDSDLREYVEDTISRKLFQYVGTSDTTLSLALPTTMALHLEGQADDPMSQETIKKNLDAFAKEAEAVPRLERIQVRMITSTHKKETTVYSVHYSRENGDERFNKQNVSEQNLKNDGGKG